MIYIGHVVQAKESVIERPADFKETFGSDPEDNFKMGMYIYI